MENLGFFQVSVDLKYVVLLHVYTCQSTIMYILKCNMEVLFSFFIVQMMIMSLYKGTFICCTQQVCMQEICMKRICLPYLGNVFDN